MDNHKLYSDVQIVPIDKIKPSPFENPNEFSEELYESLKNDIAENGLIANILIVNSRDNTLLDGNHRLRVLQELGYLEVPVIYYEPIDDIDAKILSVSLNQKRGTFNEQRLHNLIMEIYDSGRYPLEELKERLGFNISELKEKLETIKVDENLIKKIEQEAMESEKNMPVPINFVLTQEQLATVTEALDYANGKTKGEKLQFISRAFLYQKLDEEKLTR